MQATYNNLDAAVDYILKQREEKKLVREHERIRKFVLLDINFYFIFQQIGRYCTPAFYIGFSFADKHRCVDGSQINLTVLKQLNGMGYTNLISTYALVDSNNDIDQGLLWIDNLRRKLQNLYPDYVIDVVSKTIL